MLDIFMMMGTRENLHTLLILIAYDKFDNI